MNTGNGLIMFYLLRSEASYQSFTGSTYGLACFYNKCALIKTQTCYAKKSTVFLLNKASFKGGWGGALAPLDILLPP